MLALALLIPITPNPVTIVRIVMTITSSMVEKPPPLRVVCKLALLFRIRISKWKNHGGPLSNRGARKVLWTKFHKAISSVD
jgi:hypothetical protein